MATVIIVMGFQRWVKNARRKRWDSKTADLWGKHGTKAQQDDPAGEKARLKKAHSTRIVMHGTRVLRAYSVHPGRKASRATLQMRTYGEHETTVSKTELTQMHWAHNNSAKFGRMSSHQKSNLLDGLTVALEKDLKSGVPNRAAVKLQTILRGKLIRKEAAKRDKATQQVELLKAWGTRMRKEQGSECDAEGKGGAG